MKTCRPHTLPGLFFCCVLSSLLLINGSALGTAPAPESRPDASSGDRWNPAWLEREWWSLDPLEPARRTRLARHQYFIEHGVPDEYRGKRSPFAISGEIVREGRAVYAAHCQECHGPVGMGDGNAALAVNPSPALLAFMIQTPMAIDEYLMWSISEGGPPFGTDMPSFKDKLSAAQIWKVIAFMRAGFPHSD